MSWPVTPSLLGGSTVSAGLWSVSIEARRPAISLCGGAAIHELQDICMSAELLNVETQNLDCAIHQFPFYKPLTCLWPLTSLSHLHNISIPSPTCHLSQHRFNLATLTASSLPSRMVSSKVSIAGSSVSSCSWLAPSSYSWSCHDLPWLERPHPRPSPKHPQASQAMMHFLAFSYDTLW